MPVEQLDTAEQELLYTADEVAATLRVSRSTIHRRIAAGEIDAFRVGREYRIPASARRAYFKRIGYTGGESAEPVSGGDAA